MKKNKSLLFALVLLLSVFFTSCQKVIQLDLSSSVPQLVIQGNIYDWSGPYVVKISKTVNFDAPSIHPSVNNALVTISDNTGITENLSQIADGTYVTSTIRGILGRTYYLTVKVDGVTYTASSTMREAVKIDSIYYKKAIFGGGNVIVLDFNNLPNVENYYRVINFVNGNQSTGFNIFSNFTSKATEINYTIMSTNFTPTPTRPKLEKGDVIEVWLECIDKGVFEYFRTANSEGGQNASPANPVSNISNGALGYFNACTVRKDSIIYP
jgi:hypothetical protein